MHQGETCDDGNTTSGDGCSANCQSNETCGNGVVDPGEQCDPGGNIFTSTCNPDCTKAHCGDGEVNMPAGEQCDDGNSSNTDACTNACKNNVCGDGFVFTGKEQFGDDGNTNNSDGCRNDCTLGPGNDFKTTPQDITGGGTFTESMANAKDDFHSDCSDMGGKDVFFTFTITKTEIVYFDTFNSDFDSSIAVYSGGCTTISNTNNEVDCNDDTACGDVWSQDAMELSSGQYCLVVDYADHTDTHTHLVLTMHEGGRDGDELDFDANGSGSVSDDLSMATNVTTADAACGATPGADLGYYFTGCPVTVTVNASTCGTPFDTGLYLRQGNANGTTDIACNDDDPMCGMASTIVGTITSPDLYWLIVDSYDTNVGPFTMTYMVQ